MYVCMYVYMYACDVVQICWISSVSIHLRHRRVEAAPALAGPLPRQLAQLGTKEAAAEAPGAGGQGGAPQRGREPIFRRRTAEIACNGFEMGQRPAFMAMASIEKV